MKRKVFYSWQSDLPNNTNRSLIESSLNKAAKEIESEDTDIEPVIDRDTKGVAGSPNIATTIFDKIKKSHIFVADVSIIGKAGSRPTPNPNVLIELGYGLDTLGHEAMILVFNEAFGKVEDLPFDLRMYRTLTYFCPEDSTDRSEIKKELTRDLKVALSAGFSAVKNVEPKTPILDIIKNDHSSKKVELRSHLSDLLGDLDNKKPKMRQYGGTAEDLIEAISKTKNSLIDFTKLCNTIVLMEDFDSANEIFNWFGDLLTRYYPIVEGSPVYNCNGDFFKFIGHELFVIFVSSFIKEQKWDNLEKILDKKLKVGPTQYHRRVEKKSWVDLSDHSPLLIDLGNIKRRESLRADILKERHESPELFNISSLEDFTEADFFLHLYGPRGVQDNKYYGEWYPRSALWIPGTPQFVADSLDYQTAYKISKVLKMSGLDDYKKRLSNLQLGFSTLSYLSTHEIESIGSEGVD